MLDQLCIFYFDWAFDTDSDLLANYDWLTVWIWAGAGNLWRWVCDERRDEGWTEKSLMRPEANSR